MGVRLPRAEWMRREYWKAKAKDPMTNGEPPKTPEPLPGDADYGDEADSTEGPEGAQGEQQPPQRASRRSKVDIALKAWAEEVQAKIEADESLSIIERGRWLIAIKVATSSKPATVLQGGKLLAELAKTASAALTGTPEAGGSVRDAGKTPEQLAAELMKQRLAEFKRTTPKAPPRDPPDEPLAEAV